MKAKTKKAVAKKPKMAGSRQQTPSVQKQLISKDMSFGEVLQRFPHTFPVFGKYGMHCLGCSMSAFETIEQGAQAHGIDVKKFVADLNAAASAKK